MPVLKLTLANLRQRLTRTLLTLCAITAAVSLVVSVTTGYASVAASAKQFLDNYLGSSDVRFSAGADAQGLPMSLVDEIGEDPDIASAFGRFEASTQIPTPGEEEPLPVTVSGVDPISDDYLSRLELVGGRLFTDPNADEVVVDQVLQRRLGVELGETIKIPGPHGTRELELVGVVHKPEIIAALLQTAYVPIGTLQRTLEPNDPDRVTAVIAEFGTGVDGEAFVKRWQERLESLGAAWEVRLTRQDREAVDRGIQGIGLASLLGGMVSLLAATFIVFGTLSMGVTERQRQLAMLRAIGMTRGQVAAGVIGEGLILAVGGILVGIPLGVAFIHLLSWWFDGLFNTGVTPSWNGIAAATGGMTLAALVASLLPAIKASRLDPLEAMSPSAAPATSGFPWRGLVIGLACMSVDAIFVHAGGFGSSFSPLTGFGLWTEWEKEVRFWGHLLLGLPLLFLGFFLVAPTLVWLVDKILAWPTAKLLKTPPALLRHQLSSGLWRAAGTAAALMVGLATLLVMNIQGRSAIAGWQLPDKFPDVFLYDATGIDLEQIEAIGKTEGIRHDENGQPRVMPIGYFNPYLGDNLFSLAGAAFQPQRTMYVAINPSLAFEMMDLQFTLGDVATAKRMLESGRQLTLEDGTVLHGTYEETVVGRIFLTLAGEAIDPATLDIADASEGLYLIVTEEFRQMKGIQIGDPFVLERRGEGVAGLLGEEVEFTIVGVVNSPGIDVMVATFDLGRQFRQQSAASVFGTIEAAREEFGMTQARLVGADLELGVDKKELITRLRKELGQRGLNVADVRELKYEIQTQFYLLLTVASTVAWSALAVASIGVANTVMASVRSRRWQMGVLRAVGTTRGELIRLIVAEALLLGVVGVVLGCSAGLMMAVNARGIQQVVIGYVPPITLPWDVIGMGVAVVMLVSALAAAWPAITTAATAPLRLLQAGRASA